LIAINPLLYENRARVDLFILKKEWVALKNSEYFQEWTEE